MRGEWENFGGRRGEGPVQQFQRVAKRSLAQLKIWNKEEFGGRKKKQNELIEKLKTAKQTQT